jgi:hypothetical protein
MNRFFPKYLTVTHRPALSHLTLFMPTDTRQKGERSTNFPQPVVCGYEITVLLLEQLYQHVIPKDVFTLNHSQIPETSPRPSLLSFTGLIQQVTNKKRVLKTYFFEFFQNRILGCTSFSNRFFESVGFFPCCSSSPEPLYYMGEGSPGEEVER